MSAAEVSLLVGSQFLLQLLLEIPAGTWAEREDRSNILSIAYVCFAVYAAVYCALGVLHPPFINYALRRLVVPASTEVLHVVTVAGAIVAEAFFGIASALLSGTLDSWVAEIERAKAGDDASAFRERLERVKSSPAPSAWLSSGTVQSRLCVFRGMRSCPR